MILDNSLDVDGLLHDEDALGDEAIQLEKGGSRKHRHHVGRLYSDLVLEFIKPSHTLPLSSYSLCNYTRPLNTFRTSIFVVKQGLFYFLI